MSGAEVASRARARAPGGQGAATRIDQAAILIFLANIVLGAWLAMTASGDALMGGAAPGSLAHAALIVLMWASMMVAMMLPGAAPAILIYAAMTSKLAGARGLRVCAFVAGYGAVWLGFSVAAALVQLLLARLVPMSGMMALGWPMLGGLILLAAGAYQLSPLKATCLIRCQSPVIFFARNWRTGPWGAAGMGAHHGLFCLGCCWVLMGLLFYGGVMETAWISGLAVYVLLEKTLPPRWPVRQWTGGILILWGAAELGRLAFA